MSSRIFKNHQINVGMPFQIKSPLNFDTIRKAETFEETEVETPKFDIQETYQELIQKAKDEAELILKEAKYEADRIIENAAQEANDNMQAALEEAKQQGYNDGFSEVKKQYEDLIQEAEFIKEHAKTEYKEVLDSIESDAVNVILDIAKKVIGIELSMNKDDVLYLVKQAFEKCGNKENVILKVSPDDYTFLIENKDRLMSLVEGTGDIDIKKDTSLKVGACLLETQFGSIDASVQTKLDKIEKAFRQLIGK